MATRVRSRTLRPEKDGAGSSLPFDSCTADRFVSRGEEKYEVIQGEDTRWEKLIGYVFSIQSVLHPCNSVG
jgi:hypothetical protein